MSRSFATTIQGTAGPQNSSSQKKPLQLPGFHWDAEMKRYFKVDKTQKNSYWNQSNIRERETKKRQVEKARKRAASESHRPNRIARSRELLNPLLGGYLARELFGPVSPATRSIGTQGFPISGLGTSKLGQSGLDTDFPTTNKRIKRIQNDKGRLPRLNPSAPIFPESADAPNSCLTVSGLSNGGMRPGLDLDFQNGCLVSGYGLKGRFDMHPGLGEDHEYGNLPSFLMSGKEDRLGMGIAYATSDRLNVRSAYLPFDRNGYIDFKHDKRPGHMLDMCIYQEQIRTPGISSIKYHDSTNRIIITSEGHESSCSIYLFNPAQNRPDEPGPAWLLGETDFYQRIAMQVDPHTIWWTNANAIAPETSSSLICALGTNSGIVTFDRKDKLCSIIPPNLSPGEIFGLDFLPRHNDVVVAGGRRGSVLLADLRIPPERFEYSAIIHGDRDWYGTSGCLNTDRKPCAKEGEQKQKPQQQQPRRHVPRWHSSNVPISHVVGMNEHQVLVAGMRHNMCIYDLRWRQRQHSNATNPGSNQKSDGVGWKGRGPKSYSSGQTHMPIVTFPTYHNDVHLQHGLAVSDSSSSPVGQIVAVAHDDGSIGLYSAKTGWRLPSPAVDRIRGRKNTPVRCLQWASMPQETQESLWMGVGTEVVGVGMTWDHTEGEVDWNDDGGGGGDGTDGGTHSIAGQGKRNSVEVEPGTETAALARAPGPALTSTPLYRLGRGRRDRRATTNTHPNVAPNAHASSLSLDNSDDNSSSDSSSRSDDSDDTSSDSESGSNDDQEN